MICVRCTHPLGWHGDRAIGGCWDESRTRRFRVSSAFAVLDDCPPACEVMCDGFKASNRHRS